MDIFGIIPFYCKLFFKTISKNRLVSISDEDSLSEITLSDASKLASTYFTLFYKSVHVLYTGIGLFCESLSY